MHMQQGWRAARIPIYVYPCPPVDTRRAFFTSGSSWHDKTSIMGRSAVFRRSSSRRCAMTWDVSSTTTHSELGVNNCACMSSRDRPGAYLSTWSKYSTGTGQVPTFDSLHDVHGSVVAAFCFLRVSRVRMIIKRHQFPSRTLRIYAAVTSDLKIASGTAQQRGKGTKQLSTPCTSQQWVLTPNESAATGPGSTAETRHLCFQQKPVSRCVRKL